MLRREHFYVKKKNTCRNKTTGSFGIPKWTRPHRSYFKKVWRISYTIPVPIMEAFPSAKHLCSWAGLTPTNNESAGKKKSVRVSKAGCYIKPLLVQCANAVVKSKKHLEIRNRYLRLKKRRGHKKVIIAIARMLLTALYHMLKNGENYNAELYRKSALPPADLEITVEQAIIIARNQGYKIKSATA